MGSIGMSQMSDRSVFVATLNVPRDGGYDERERKYQWDESYLFVRGTDNPWVYHEYASTELGL